MKIIITCMILLFCYLLSAIDDGILHFTAGNMIAVSVHEFTWHKGTPEPLSYIYGQSAAITAGILKELYDKKTDGKFSGMDLNYTCLGAMCSVLPNFILDRVLFPSKTTEEEYYEIIQKRRR